MNPGKSASTYLPQVPLEALIDLARRAGDATLKVYQRDFEVQDKADDSPLTEADLASHRILCQGLAKLAPEVPLLSEESDAESFAQRQQWQRYWLIDPLDGTKEFIKKNGEFTVNIALVDAGKPVLGIVYAPVLDCCYWGGAGLGAFKQSQAETHPIEVSPVPEKASNWRLVGSRSHQSEAFASFLEAFDKPEIVSMGSSLKLCLVAEGAADLYPRLGPTSEWDTAAAQAVVEAAGGQVLAWPELIPLRCNQNPESLLNPQFVVCARPSPVWQP